MKYFAIQALSMNSMIQLYEETDNFPTLITLEETKWKLLRKRIRNYKIDFISALDFVFGI